MTCRTAALALWTLALGLTVTALVFLAVNGDAQHSDALGAPALDAVIAVVFLAFPTVGGLVAARRPRNPIGWLLLAGGIGAALQAALLGYATHALVADPGSLPGGAAVGLVADAIWIPSLALATALPFLLFPHGRLASRGRRGLVALLATASAGYVAATLLTPGPLYYFAAEENPLDVAEAGELATLGDLSGQLMILLAVVAAIDLVVRFRRAAGPERRQIAWVVAACALLAAATPAVIALGVSEVEVAGVNVSALAFSLLLALLPISVGVGILRHRLYDIDVVVSRTLVYGALTAILGAAYLALVLLLGLALGPLTDESDLAVALSTLAVAALFRPARRRVQALVDRRFSRRRYDARRTLEGFSVRLRAQTDLEALRHELTGVVRETMQPAHVSLWLREARG